MASPPPTAHRNYLSLGMIFTSLRRATRASHLGQNALTRGKLATPQSRYRAVETMAKSAYTLYTAGTPNGVKASVALEELGLSYETHAIDISKNTQKEDWFLKINPNGRIPALVDHEAGDLAVFESGAILYYLADKYPDKGLWGRDARERANIVSWLMFQMGGLGPMQGQANHFVAFAPVKLDYPIKRYVEETYRLFGVLEIGLQNADYLANDKYSIADIASFPWVVAGFFAGLTIENFPKVQAWVQRIQDRPAVKKGLGVPSQGPIWQNLYSSEPQPDLQKRQEDGKKAYENAVAALQK